MVSEKGEGDGVGRGGIEGGMMVEEEGDRVQKSGEGEVSLGESEGEAVAGAVALVCIEEQKKVDHCCLARR